MEELRNEFFSFLEERKADVLEKANVLQGEDRKDESNTLKAKANIYDIFKALWDASEKTADADHFHDVFMQKATVIPGNWENSLKLAKEHNDAAKVMIEEAKLAAVAEIKEKFNSMF